MTVPPEIVQLISGSGNSFHAKVARWLRAKGWHVVVSPYYMDQTQNKAREIDLVAERLWPTANSFGQRNGDLAVRLFIECKFIPAHSVFWFAEKNQTAAQELVCSGGVFGRNNTYANKHHYLATSPKVAKLFTTEGGRGQEADPFYKALNQSLNAMTSMRGQPVTLPAPVRGRPWSPRVVLEFPVVVCSSFDQLFAVDFYDETAPTKISENFQLEVRYAYMDRGGSQRDDYFLLDVVEFDRLEAFANSIGEDAEVAAFFLASS